MGYDLIRISLNGSLHECRDQLSLWELLSQLKKNPNFHVLEYNGNIVEKNSYKMIFLSQGDCLEIISFVGGGSFVFKINCE